ncbi:hypothetical protein HNR42_000575 [Deinobacterium chartae]|uniref:Uncharacterized protein n=1 Tax=Deinobacterium chartae TaxID=521158 RepID=A0A841HUM3_9DEIO|nr:hypothetical protein [Deinobacterium chartae]
MREFLNDWYRLLKLTVMILAVPLVLYGLLRWLGLLA